MKPILLKTLAAVSLTAAADAQVPAVHVLGAVWKERAIDASTGTIDQTPGTVAATRAYFVFDPSVMTDTPLPVTKIEYADVRAGGVITRSYWIDSNFTAFLADTVLGDNAGRRVFGNLYAPVQIADVTNAMTPFTGTTLSSGYPKKLSFDSTSFITGSTTGAAGPRLAPLGAGTAKRSVISGSANAVNVTAATPSAAVDELEARLVKAGYNRGAVAPVIATDLPATIVRDGYQVRVLSVTLGADVYPTPGYQWFKDDAGGTPVAIAGATSATYNVAAGTDGDGTYSVVLTTSGFPSVSSGKTVVTTTPVALAFTTDLPETETVPFDGTKVLFPVVKPNAFPQPTTYQWQDSPDGTTWTAVSAGRGGNQPSLTIGGTDLSLNKPQHYRLVVENDTETITSVECHVTVVGP